MALVGVCRVQANCSHYLGGLVHFGGKQCRLGGFDSFWREVRYFLFGPFWRVQSYELIVRRNSIGTDRQTHLKFIELLTSLIGATPLLVSLFSFSKKNQVIR
jgi:hypothetical protein